MPASRCSASRTCISFCSSCASYARSWKRQPPHAGKCAHGASTRSGPGRSTSVASASAWLRLTFVTRARTRSPGKPAPHEDDEAVEPRDPVAAVRERVDVELELLSLCDGRGHARTVASERRDVDLALARAVELAEEDALVRAEREASVAQRDEHLRARGERGAGVGRRVRPVLRRRAATPSRRRRRAGRRSRGRSRARGRCAR